MVDQIKTIMRIKLILLIEEVHQMMKNEEDTFDQEANSGDRRSAPDDENEEEMCDEEANSENILGENENLQRKSLKMKTHKKLEKKVINIYKNSHYLSSPPLTLQ